LEKKEGKRKKREGRERGRFLTSKHEPRSARSARKKKEKERNGQGLEVLSPPPSVSQEKIIEKKKEKKKKEKKGGRHAPILPDFVMYCPKDQEKKEKRRGKESFLIIS